MNTNQPRTRSDLICPPWFLVTLLGCFFFSLLSCLTTQTAAAQDRITLRDTRTGKQTEFQALVTSWDEEQLVYSADGRENTVTGIRVVGVAYQRSEAQIIADELFREGKFAQAYQSYESAIAAERRDWIKVDLLAQHLRCASALNRQTDAMRAFFQIEQITKRTRYFHFIPIPWDKTRADGLLVSQYMDWISGQDEIRALIGSSWMLSNDKDAAVAKLKELAQSGDSRVAHLANAQLWRTQTVSANSAQLQRWQAAIDRMPESFQAGPRFQIALAMKQQVQNGNSDLLDRTLVAMLQIPILYPEHYQLAGSALAEANQLLTGAGRNDEANLVMSELKRDFGFSSAASASGTRLENMDQ